VLALLEACDLAELGETDPERVFLVETWTGPAMTLELDSMLVESAAGEVVAYGDVTARDVTAAIYAFSRLHPEPAEETVATLIAARMVAWAERRASERAVAGSTRLRHSTSAFDRRTVGALRANGYQHVRTFWHMQRSLDGLGTSGPPPDGIRIRPMVVGRDEHGMYEADIEAFRDHFGFEDLGEEAFWREWTDFGPHDPSLMFLAEEASGGVVGVCMTFIDEGIGWVGEIGVRPAWRGRGIGTALLSRSFAEFASRGARVTQLNVDSKNESGATRLYERVGMSVRREFPVYEKQIEAASNR
jgi:mycothiol synthase